MMKSFSLYIFIIIDLSFTSCGQNLNKEKTLAFENSIVDINNTTNGN